MPSSQLHPGVLKAIVVVESPATLEKKVSGNIARKILAMSHVCTAMPWTYIVGPTKGPPAKPAWLSSSGGVHLKLFSFVCSIHVECAGCSSPSPFLPSFFVVMKIASTVKMEVLQLMNPTNILLIRMSVCVLTSMRLLWAPFKFWPLMYFHTLPRSYPSSLDFDLWRGHNLKPVMMCDGVRINKELYLGWNE